MQPLNNATVERVARPVTILQFGTGNFLRAFADWMVQQANDANLTNHGIAACYATHRPDRVDPLVRQDGLYHVVLEGMRDGRQVRRTDLVDVVQEVVDPWKDPDHLSELAASKDLRLVISNTTEAGICWREDALQHRPASSFPGQLTQLLHDRFIAFDGADEAGLHILACELIEDNGRVLQDLVRRHARQAGWGDDFTAWVDRANHFHDTLVDRIVSGFPTDEAAAIAEETGFDDRAVVKGELFALWVIGGDDGLGDLLPLDRLPLGAMLVAPEDVAPFRSKKVRVLNSCHTALAQLGPHLGYETVDQAYGDPDLRAFVDEMVADEVLPTIDGAPAELRAFADSILGRFDNTSLHHRLADISLNSAAKWRARNLPVVQDRWAAGAEAHRNILSLAALLLLYAGRTGAETFTPRDEPGIVDAVARVFDTDDLHGWVIAALDALGLGALPESPRLADETTAAARLLLDSGCREAVRSTH